MIKKRWIELIIVLAIISIHLFTGDYKEIVVILLEILPVIISSRKNQE